MRRQDVSQLTHFIHPSYCFYVFIVGIITGIILSLTFRWDYFYKILYLIASVISLFVCLIYPRRFMLILAFLAGIVLANFRVVPELNATEYLQGFIGKTVIISGNITNKPTTENGTVYLEELKLNLPRGTPGQDYLEEVILPGSLYVKLSDVSQLSQSDSIAVEGILGDGFGTFVASMFRPRLVSIEKSANSNIFLEFKNNFSNATRNLIDEPAVSLGLAYLMGDKSGLSDKFSEQLRAVGMTHVVVASGAHLGILMSATKKIFGRVSRFAGTLSALLMIFSFASVVGFTPSMTRAVLVAVLSLLVGYVGRKFTPLRLISLVATITLMIEPTYLFNLGWQLSFSSFFGIMVVGPLLNKWLYGGKKPPWLASMLLTSISTTFVCAPILIYNFGTISLLSLAANLIILPTLPYVMLFVLLTGALSWCVWVAQFFAKIATILLNLHIWIIELLSQQKMFIFTFTGGNSYIFLLYIPVIVLLILLKCRCNHKDHLEAPVACLTEL